MSRILVIAHGHPALSIGGGEIAAARECAELRRQGHEVLFMARAPTEGAHCGTPFSVIGEDILFHSPDYDHFLHSQRAKWAVYKQFRALLERFAPDIVHFHHFVFLGLEMVREVRKWGPQVPILMTLHEYLAICNNHGQMVKIAGPLCEGASPAACNACFPDHSPQQFFLRETFIKTSLRLVDVFLCPSAFLRQRYVAWGLPAEKLHVLENGQPLPPAATDPPPPDRHRRIAFFGQLSALKGIFVFLDAVRALPAPVRASLTIEIYGSDQHQQADFRDRFAQALAATGDAVRWYGPYRQADLPALMRRTGWIVVPSVWWENSPLVIQEAFANGCPVICADIGGMAEKVRHGVDGLHFIAGNAGDLALRLADVAGDPGLHARLSGNILPPVLVAETVAAMIGKARGLCPLDPHQSRALER